MRHKAYASQPHTLPSHTGRSANQNLPKSMATQPHGRKESTGTQHCIRAIAGEVVNSGSLL